MRILIAFILLALPAMAGRFFDAASSTQFGVGTIAPISPPITLAGFAYPWASSNCVILAIGSSTNGTERLQVFFGTGPKSAAATAVNTAGTAGQASGSFDYPIQTDWAHFTGVFSSSTLRVVYTNGVPCATNTTSITADGLDTVAIGARKNAGVYGAPMYGRLAECAVWNVALTDAEILSLSLGASPMLIRPASLVFYSPLTGRETSTEWNLCGPAVSLTNAPTSSAVHPRRYLP